MSVQWSVILNTPEAMEFGCGTWVILRGDQPMVSLYDFDEAQRIVDVVNAAGEKAGVAQ